MQANDGDALAKIDAEIPRRRREYDFVKQSFREVRPSYFNSGCCCFKDGNITGIEITEGGINLIKWSKGERIIAERTILSDLKI
jgi:hypothetical protein